jgi:(1->4)-alpha-D-glucan 1-alpha-D-glucosylmutase
MIEHPAYVPVSTYRLQLHKDFAFAAARDTATYLARLGVGACYTSPYFTAVPGSTHGYDVVNHNEINPELGGAEAHAAFVARLQELGLGHVVDFVPNHMSNAAGTNLWWRDVLENGPSSPAAKFFDIDWSPAKAALRGKVLLPILGDQYGNVLERGELQLEFTAGALVLHYFDQVLPINPRQAPRLYKTAVDAVTSALGPDNPQLHEFLSIIASLENMPPYSQQDPERMAARQREKEVARGRLARLVAESDVVREQIETTVRRFNGEPGRPESFDALHELLESQAYRLAYWRTASDEINYRRFFDVNTLAGLRVEDPDVFAATHQLLAQLIRERKVNGVRVDHSDGLFDPAGYFRMLQELAPEPPLYVVAEKILSAHEHLKDSWEVHGTTGYNFLNLLNGIFVDAKQARRLWRVYERLTGRGEPFEDVLYDSKRLIMQTAMASELNVLAHALDEIGERSRRSRDFTLETMRGAITEVVACFPVYRTYVDDAGWTSEDRNVVERAIKRARRRNPAMERSLFDFFREVVLPRDVDADPHPFDRRGGFPPSSADDARERRRFAMKLQQYTGPVQAKGLEDTACYRYNVLLSLNDVGGDPTRIGRSVEDFHAANAERLGKWPLEMLATSTHDTKLGEDVRARVNAIAELPDEWGREVSKWMRINKAARTIVDGEPAPDRNDEYRFYQTLAGVWPPAPAGGSAPPTPEFVERLQGYMIKAAREAKIHTSWLTQNAEYETALTEFVARVLHGPGAARFLPQLLPFVGRIAVLGCVNSLAQLTLKIGSPGVPDFYQGSELWDLNLVDPDNRRPVDFALRTRLLDDVDRVLSAEGEDRLKQVAALFESWHDGRIKLLLTAAGLRLRRAQPELFLRGDYMPLTCELTVEGGVAAFARVRGDQVLVAAAPRLVAPLQAAGHAWPLGGAAWKTSRILLPPGLAQRTFRHALTGAEVKPVSTGAASWIFVGQVFETVPVGLLT